MFMPQPPNQLDNGQAPPTAMNNPEWMQHVMDRPDGGYNWGNRSFSPSPGQRQPAPFHPDLARPPIMMPHNPVPQQPPSLAQMRNIMTQFHVQQMLARMQNHVMGHAGGGQSRNQ